MLLQHDNCKIRVVLFIKKRGGFLLLIINRVLICGVFNSGFDSMRCKQEKRQKGILKENAVPGI